MMNRNKKGPDSDPCGIPERHYILHLYKINIIIKNINAWPQTFVYYLLMYLLIFSKCVAGALQNHKFNGGKKEENEWLLIKKPHQSVTFILCK